MIWGIRAVDRGAGLPRRRFVGLVASWAVVTTFVFTVLLLGTAGDASANPRYAAYIMDAHTGKVLYARNARERKYPASLTKIMTLYMVFDALRAGEISLNSTFTVSARAAGQEPSRLGLKAGQTIRVKDAVLALVTKSANDVAVTIAENLAKTEYQFALRMTETARGLGMSRTAFRNASGLPNRQQLSTAEDMAKLAIALQRDFPEYYHMFSTQRFSYKGRSYKNHNNLLARYEGTDGIKTGYIRASGFNLVASVKRGPYHLIGVVFGGRSARSRDTHLIGLFDEGFRQARDLGLVAKAPPLPVRRPVEIASAASVASAGVSGERAPGSGMGAVSSAAPGRGNDAIVAIPLPRPEQGSYDDERAPAAAAAAPASPRVTPGWGIQVGAYGDPGSARRMIDTARRNLPMLLDGTNGTVEKATLEHGTFYRARLLGMPRAEAREACALLVLRNIPCVPVPAALTVATARE